MTFNFIINCPDAKLAEFEDTPINEVEGMIYRWDLEWSLQTYQILKQRKNIPVTLSNQFREKAINIIHSASLVALKGTPRHFINCIKADFPHRDWAQYHIVQNMNEIEPDTSFIPFWTQPCLIKRNPDRNRVETVAYTGQTFNGNLAGTPQMWESLLQPFGMHFKALNEDAWHNLGEVDVLIGIRSFDKKTYNAKPATKMINAWHAGIPFIGGYDSAFSQLGTPGEDYIRVSNKEEALAAILALRDEPMLYRKLVENGRKRAASLNTETIAQQWEDVLTGPVQTRYQLWQSRPFIERLAFARRLQLGLLNHHSKQFLKLLYKPGQ